MKIEEAIEMLINEIPNIITVSKDSKHQDKRYISLSMGADALKKQIPQTVIDREKCPNCGDYLGCESFEQKCCDNCGQALKWD